MKWRHVIGMAAVQLPAKDNARNALGMSSGPTLHVSVCACTYRRPEGLRALLQGLGALEFTEMRRPGLNVIIVDNEGSETARKICHEFERQSSIPLTDVHEPRRGIPRACNAYLDHIASTCDFFAFIDDDAIPDPKWLEQLPLAQARTAADVVRGCVEPILPDDAPSWIKDGHFFEWPRRRPDTGESKLRDGQEIGSTATNNVLVRWSSVRNTGLRFDESLALTGGTDTPFFRQMSRAGFWIIVASAVVRAVFTPLTRASRHGQTAGSNTVALLDPR